MLSCIQTNHGELSVVLGNKNFRIGLSLQKVLEYLEFDESSSKVIDRRAETSTDVLQHLVEVKADRQLDELVCLMTECKAVTLVLNVLCEVVSLVHEQFKLIQWESAIAL